MGNRYGLEIVLGIVLLFPICLAATEEVCLWESFNASCPSGEIVFIESAFFGRMPNNRCFNLTDNETSCSIDVRLRLQKQHASRQSIQFKLLSSGISTTLNTSCLQNGMPLLQISHQCIKSIADEVCIEETFNATCQRGTVIHIESALFGRMRRSRCTDFDNRGLNCYANVQPYLSSICNERIGCSIKASSESLKQTESSCSTQLKPYLEVHYTCAPEFNCPLLVFPTGTTTHRISDGYIVICGNRSLGETVLCRDGKWNRDTSELCSANVSSGYVEIDEIQPDISTRYGPDVPQVAPKPLLRKEPIVTPLYESLPSSDNQHRRLPVESHIYTELILEDETTCKTNSSECQ